MRNLKLTLAYDGTRFHGWQVQPDRLTVQGEVERVLRQILNHPVSATGSGRTDAGVHAHGQVAGVLIDRSMDTDAVQRAMNALLPPDVRVLSVEEVSLEFHARFSARSKTYAYHICRAAVVSPFLYRFVLPCHHALDSPAMDDATRAIVGTHDFTSFCAAAAEVEDRVRTVFEADWERSPEVWVFRIRANGFLQHMVRTIVGTVLDVGRGKLPPHSIPRILEARDRRSAGPCVPACGLHLLRVDY